MRILIATNSYPTKKNPTWQVFVKNIAEGLRNEGMEVEVVYNPYFKYFKSDAEAGGIVSSVFKTLFITAAYLPYILYKARNFQIIYSHGVIWPGFLMRAAARIHGIKHVCYAHGAVKLFADSKGILFRFARYTLQHCDKVFTNSSYMQKTLQSIYNCQSTVISPGYKSNRFYYKPAEKKFDLFFAGNAVKRKGVDLLLDAINNNLQFYRNKSLRVQINCSGEMKNEYVHFIEENKLGDIITMGNKLEEDALSEHYRSARIVVLPSRDEPLGLVGIEAIASGALLVAADTGGIREYVTDGENGFLFEPGNVQDLQQTIEIALDRYPEFQKKQPAVSQSVQRYALDQSIQKTISIFKMIDSGYES